MIQCMTNRFAEWKRRSKENQMQKKIMANDGVEGEDDENDDDDEFRTREDIRAIENVNAIANEKPYDNKKIKATKTYTYPSIAFCKKCMRDVSSCTCVLTNSQSSQKMMEKLLEHSTASTAARTQITEATELPFKTLEGLDVIPEVREKERAVEYRPEFVPSIFPNYYKAVSAAPSVKDVYQSIHDNYNENIHQESVYLRRTYLIQTLDHTLRRLKS